MRIPMALRQRVNALEADLEMKPPKGVRHIKERPTGNALRAILRRSDVAQCQLRVLGVEDPRTVLVLPATMQSCQVYNPELGTVDRKPIREVIQSMTSVVVQYSRP